MRVGHWLILLAACLATIAAASPAARRPTAAATARLEPYVGLGHTAPMTTMAWSPDARHLATGSWDHTVVIWDADTWKPVATLAGHAREIVSLAWSPDGVMLASSDGSDRTIVWDPRTGKRRFTLVGGLRPLMSNALSGPGWDAPGMQAPVTWSNREILATSFRDQSAILWDVRTGRQRAVLKVPGSVLYAMAMSPDGKTLALGGHDLKETITLWDVAIGKRRIGFSAGGYLNALVWSPDSQALASARVLQVTLWDAATGRRRVDLEGSPAGQETAALAWSPDGKLFAGIGVGEQGKWTLWDTHTGRRRAEYPVTDPFGEKSVAWSPDGRSLAVCNGLDAVIWDPATGTRRTTLPKVRGPLIWDQNGRTLAAGSAYFPLHTAVLWNGTTFEPRVYLSPRTAPVLSGSVRWSRDGRRLAFGSIEGAGAAASVWNVSVGKQIAAFFDDSVNALAWSPDGETLAAATGDFVTLLWDVHTATVRARLPEGGRLLAWSRDSQRLATASPISTTILWDARHGKLLAPIPGATGGGRVMLGHFSHTDYEWTPSWAPEGKTLATADDEGRSVQLWDVATQTARATLRGHRHTIYAIAWSPHSRMVVTGGRDGTVVVWDVATGMRLHRIDYPSSGHWVLAWSPDSQSLAAGASRGEVVTLWSAEGGQVRGVIPTGTSGVTALAWSPQGDLLSIGGANHSVFLWDTRTRTRRGVLRGHIGSITDVAWSPNGRTLATGSEDGSVRLWSATGRELAAFYSLDQGKEWLTMTPEGYFMASPHGAEVIQWRQGGKLWPLAKFRRRFERPELVRKALAGQLINARDR
jgi:WD40 repeat protein